MRTFLQPVRRQICTRCRTLEILAILRRNRLPHHSSLFVPGNVLARPFGSLEHGRRQQEQGSKEEQTTPANGFSEYFTEEHQIPGAQYGGEFPREDMPLKPRQRNISDGGTDFKRILVNQLNRRILDVHTLGKPSRVLFLPPRKEKKVKEPARLEEPSVNVNESVDILGSLEMDNEPLDQQITFENIDMVRDRWLSQLNPSSPPSQTECIKIYEKLKRSFNVDQLEAYLRITARDEADDFDDLQGTLTTELCSRSRWYPGRSSMDKTYRERLFADTPPSDDWRILEPNTKIALRRQSQSTMTKKPTICEAILRKSWKIRSSEECQRPGELDVIVNAEYLSFLESTFGLIKQVERQLKVSFERRLDKNVFRIRGTHENCRQAFTILYAPLGAVRVKQLQLDFELQALDPDQKFSLSGAARLWDDRLLSEIGGYTKSKVTKVKNSDGNLVALDVMFLSPQQADGRYELVVFDNVRQIVDKLRSDQSNGRTSQSLIQSSMVYHPVPIHSNNSLPIILRNSDWLRFRGSDSNSAHTTNFSHVEVDTAAGRRAGSQVLGTWKRIDTGSEHSLIKIMLVSGDEPEPWEHVIYPSVSIRTGKIAFEGSAKQKMSSLELSPIANSSEIDSAISRPDTVFEKLSQQTQRIFIPSAPAGISSFQTLNEAPSTQEQRIVLTLKPTAVLLDTGEDSDDFRDVTKLPTLKIELSQETDEDGAAKIQNVRLDGSMPDLEVMMPAEEFDLQLSSTPHLRCNKRDIEMSIVKFANQLVIHDGRLDPRSVPSTLECVIPSLSKTINNISTYGPRVRQFIKDRQIDSDQDRLMSRSKLPWNLHRPPPTSELLAPSPEELSNSITSARDSLLFDEEGVGQATRSHELDHYVDDDDIDGFMLGKEAWAPYTRSITSDLLIFARYRYIGVEYHSRLHGRYCGFPLTYSIVDAGGIGGRHEELSLEARDAGGPTGLFDPPMPDRIPSPRSTTAPGEGSPALFPGDSAMDEQDAGEAQAESLTWPRGGDDASSETISSYSPVHDPQQPSSGNGAAALAQDKTPNGAGRVDGGGKDPGLNWFLPLWDAALSMVRRSR